jgi:hypothetical protein
MIETLTNRYVLKRGPMCAFSARGDGFLWVDGEFIDKSAGSWTVHDANLSGDDAVLQISWLYTSPEAYALTHTNVSEASADVGDDFRNTACP